MRRGWPACRDVTVATVEHARDTRQTFAYEYRTLRTDGTIRWCVARGRFFYDGDGPRRMIGVLGDITDRKRAEESLEQRVRERTAEVQDLFRRWPAASRRAPRPSLRRTGLPGLAT